MQKQHPLFRGTVIRGDQLAGLEFGVPTANLDIAPDLEYGVYAARAMFEHQIYDAVVCYGVGDPPKFEVHMFDFEGDLLGRMLDVELVEKVSELVAWQSTERMRQKIYHDLEMAQHVLQRKKKERA